MRERCDEHGCLYRGPNDCPTCTKQTADEREARAWDESIELVAGWISRNGVSIHAEDLYLVIKRAASGK